MSDSNERLKLIRKQHNPFKQLYNTNDVNMLNNTNVKQKNNDVIKDAGIKTKEEVVKPLINTFVRPSSTSAWSAFQAQSGVHIEDNKLFVAGTRDGRDVFDWLKLPMGTFDKFKIYKNAEKVLTDNPQAGVLHYSYKKIILIQI